MNELGQVISYVALFGFGLCILALMALCIAWAVAFIWRHIEHKFQIMNHLSKIMGHVAFLVLAVCGLAVVISCTAWVVQSILQDIW